VPKLETKLELGFILFCRRLFFSVVDCFKTLTSSSEAHYRPGVRIRGEYDDSTTDAESLEKKD
jgi:hypothetical protein